MTGAETASQPSTAGRRVLTRLLAVVVALCVLFAAIDLLLRFVMPASGLVRRTVDIQTPATLYAKLEDLRRFDGVKVVVLGDSLIFGRTMRDHGDADWQAHTLPAQLQSQLAKRYGDRPVMVANLGMNGTLPVDLEQLVRIVEPLKPDLVIFDLSLRSFSRDFGGDGDTQTRKWLADLSIGPDGRYATTLNRASAARLVKDFAVNSWQLYRLRDMVQALLFDGEPVNFLVGLRNVIDGWFKTGRTAAKAADQNDLDNIVLLMRARSRYTNIDLAADNPQRQALERILQRLTAAAQPTLIFYANENPDMLPDLLPAETFDDLQRRLAAVIAPALSPKLAFVGPLTIFPPSDFIDHVHLNQEGYRRLSGELGRRAEGLLPLARAN